MELGIENWELGIMYWELRLGSCEIFMDSFATEVIVRTMSIMINGLL